MDDADDNLENSKEKKNESFIKYESKSGDLSYSINKTRKSFIIIAKSADLIEKTEKDIIEGKIVKKSENENKNEIDIEKTNETQDQEIHVQEPLLIVQKKK